MQTDIVKQIIHLPIADRVEIIEEISRSVRRDLRENAHSSKSNLLEKRHEAIRRLRGIAKVEGHPAPSDEEILEDRINSLIEKHK